MASSIPSRALVAGLAVATLLAACNPARETLSCRRIDVPSLGPENALRTEVAADPAVVVSAPNGRIEIALTGVAGASRPVALVHASDGKELGRWQVSPSPSGAAVSRCVIGFDQSTSTCGATLAGPSHPVRGQWSLETGERQVLEASVSFRLCD